MRRPGTSAVRERAARARARRAAAKSAGHKARQRRRRGQTAPEHAALDTEYTHAHNAQTHTRRDAVCLGRLIFAFHFVLIRERTSTPPLPSPTRAGGSARDEVRRKMAAGWERPKERGGRGADGKRGEARGERGGQGPRVRQCQAGEGESARACDVCVCWEALSPGNSRAAPGVLVCGPTPYAGGGTREPPPARERAVARLVLDEASERPTQEASSNGVSGGGRGEPRRDRQRVAGAEKGVRCSAHRRCGELVQLRTGAPLDQLAQPSHERVGCRVCATTWLAHQRHPRGRGRRGAVAPQRGERRRAMIRVEEVGHVVVGRELDGVGAALVRWRKLAQIVLGAIDLPERRLVDPRVARCCVDI